jgi:hypothetical protein
MTSQHRQSVPAPVKRQLRQEAGFGCCICGHPFIQYHHIVPWAEEEHFRLEDMMVLCGRCHPLCTVGAIPVSDQRSHKIRPKNIIDNEIRGKLYINSNELSILIAGGVATEVPDLLVIAGETVLRANLNREDGRVLISAKIHGQNNESLGYLVDNEWFIKPDLVWDFESYPLYATIRHAPGEIGFSVDARGEHVAVRGKWYHRGQEVNFTPTEGRYGNRKMSRFNMSHLSSMIVIK